MTKKKPIKAEDDALKAMADIPERERWLWESKNALKGVQEGFSDLDTDKAHKMDKATQMDVDDAISRLERSFKQAEAGELKEIPSESLEFNEE